MQDLKKVKTQTLVGRRRDQERKRRRSQETLAPAFKLTRTHVIQFLSAAILLLGLFLTLYREEEIPAGGVAKVGQVILKRPQAARDAAQRPKVSPADRVPKETLAALVHDLKCTTELEVALCSQIPGAKGVTWGVMQRGLMLNVLVDGSSYLAEASRISESSAVQAGPSVEEIAMALFIHQGLPRAFNFDWGENNLTVALFTEREGSLVPFAALASVPKELATVKAILSPKLMERLGKGETSVLLFTRNFYDVY